MSRRFPKFYVLLGIFILVVIGAYVLLKPSANVDGTLAEGWQPLKTAPAERLNEADTQAIPVIHDEVPTVVGFAKITSSPLNSSTMANSVICVENASDVKEIALFMPTMGHGTEPPQIAGPTSVPAELAKRFASTKDPGCFDVAKMQMYMPGLWEIRVAYKSSSQVALGYWFLDL